MNSVWSNNLSLIYQRYTLSGCKDIMIRKPEFLPKFNFLATDFYIVIDVSVNMYHKNLEIFYIMNLIDAHLSDKLNFNWSNSNQIILHVWFPSVLYLTKKREDFFSLIALNSESFLFCLFCINPQIIFKKRNVKKKI